MNALQDNGPEGPTAAVYVHVPFCTDRCIYCAFSTVPDAPSRHEALVEAVVAEHSRSAVQVDPHTVYLGGGTPSRLSPPLLKRLLSAVDPSSSAAETTLEANPADVSPQTLTAWIDLGINRVSIGVQTFRGDVLRRLGRHHDGDRARQALSMVAGAWRGTWTADLLVGWAGQTAEDLLRDVDDLLEFDPPHVSIYGLTVEPGTGLADLQALGRAVTAPPEVLADLDSLWSDRLVNQGLERYEVSNFARPGHRSQHNQAYWSNASYLGLGPGACSSVHPLRWANLRNPETYVERLGRGLSVRESVERVVPAERLLESLAVGLRTADGLAASDLERRFGSEAIRHIRHAAAPFFERDWMRFDGDRIHLAPGQLVRVDRLMVELASRLHAI